MRSVATIGPTVVENASGLTGRHLTKVDHVRNDCTLYCMRCGGGR